MNAPGVKLLRQQELVIDDRPWEVAFEDVRVPVEDRIGEEGEGFRHAQNWLNVGRIRHGARAIGVIERCLELGVAYAKQRVTFGQPLADRQAVQWMLADAFMDLHQLRLMVYHAAWKYERGEDIRVEAYMAKIFGDCRSFAAADNCMEIHGGMGLATDLPIEKILAQPAQHDDHRRPDRSSEDDARAPRAAHTGRLSDCAKVNQRANL